MAEYQFILDDGRSAELEIDSVEAMDDEEAELLARMRLATSPMLEKIIIMRRSVEVATLEQSS
ncbi:hypothetical protein [Brevundimonas sp.]|uniref:hypothetical protein n=1 Tax=Brevundimonas sp. TaxID=1871086 RepID=UPI0028A9BC13|nr:hypothetical protein [Brevundimonas sp.]